MANKTLAMPKNKTNTIIPKRDLSERSNAEQTGVVQAYYSYPTGASLRPWIWIMIHFLKLKDSNLMNW